LSLEVVTLLIEVFETDSERSMLRSESVSNTSIRSQGLNTMCSFSSSVFILTLTLAPVDRSCDQIGSQGWHPAGVESQVILAPLPAEEVVGVIADAMSVVVSHTLLVGG
jgi:hypothetical protein